MHGSFAPVNGLVMEDVTFTGGLHWPTEFGIGLAADSPLVRLRVHEHGVSMGPASLLAKLVSLGRIPRYEFGWDGIRRAERVKKGVRHLAQGMDQSVVFVTHSDAAIQLLSLLETHGVTVDHNVHQVHWWEQADL